MGLARGDVKQCELMIAAVVKKYEQHSHLSVSLYISTSFHLSFVSARTDVALGAVVCLQDLTESASIQFHTGITTREL